MSFDSPNAPPAEPSTPFQISPAESGSTITGQGSTAKRHHHQNNNRKKLPPAWTTVKDALAHRFSPASGDREGGTSTSARSDDPNFVSEKLSAGADDIHHRDNFVADEDADQINAMIDEMERREARAAANRGEESSRQAAARP
ncbi:uncharacterized protein BKA78DRAFT_290839 [Phyllosticta capitalensis]|uniref:uncharacterized protein n=1 Tax=Phyllosticta capitalensis TaxID=121624 RepID=UPI00313070AB